MLIGAGRAHETHFAEKNREQSTTEYKYEQ